MAFDESCFAIRLRTVCATNLQTTAYEKCISLMSRSPWNRADSRKRDVSVHSKRYGVHELGGVGYECEEGDTKKLFRYARSFEDDIHDIHENLCRWATNAVQGNVGENGRKMEEKTHQR